MKESFIFYRSFYEALKELSKEDRVEIIDAICELALNENEVELKSGIQKAMFALMKPQIEANNKRYANGCKAKTKHREGQEKEEIEPSKSEREAKQKQTRSETEAKAKQEASKPEANENVNDNDNENVNEKEIKEKTSPSSDDTCVQGEKDKKAEKIPYDSIIAYLNQIAGKNFSAQSKSTRSKIKARWKEGYRSIDFKHVIDVKAAQWLNDEKMEGYLRPDTLFGAKFESYLNETHKPKMNTGLPDWYAKTELQRTPEEQAKAEERKRELVKKEEERRRREEEESKKKDAETQNTVIDDWPF